MSDPADDVLVEHSALKDEAGALGFDLTDDQIGWLAMLLSNQPVTFIGSRKHGRDYALKAAAEIARSRDA